MEILWKYLEILWKYFGNIWKYLEILWKYFELFGNTLELLRKYLETFGNNLEIMWKNLEKLWKYLEISQNALQWGEIFCVQCDFYAVLQLQHAPSRCPHCYLLKEAAGLLTYVQCTMYNYCAMFNAAIIDITQQYGQPTTHRSVHLRAVDNACCVFQWLLHFFLFHPVALDFFN